MACYSLLSLQHECHKNRDKKIMCVWGGGGEDTASPFFCKKRWNNIKEHSRQTLAVGKYLSKHWAFVLLTWIQYGNSLGWAIGADGSINGLTIHPRSHCLLSLSQHPVLHHRWNHTQDTIQIKCNNAFSYSDVQTYYYYWHIILIVIYPFLDSSMSVDNTGSECSSSTSVDSTDSSKCPRAGWAAEHQGWSAGLLASLELNIRSVTS